MTVQEMTMEALKIKAFDLIRANEIIQRDLQTIYVEIQKRDAESQ